MTYYQRLLVGRGGGRGIDMDRPYRELSARTPNAPDGGQRRRAYTVTYENRFGRTRRYDTNFEGALPWLERRYEIPKATPSARVISSSCAKCRADRATAARLNPISLAVSVGGLSIAELSGLSLAGASAALADLELTDRDEQIAGRVIKEIRARLDFLLNVGLDYLTLSVPPPPSQAVRRSVFGWRPRSVPAWWGCCTSSTNRRSACTSVTTSD